MKIKYGIARRVINPNVPISLAGYFNLRMWDHVLDDLEVRAVVFRKGPAYAAILHFDILCTPLYLCDAILEKIQDSGMSQFHRGNVTLCATHTHTAPEVRIGQGHNPDYIPFLAEQAVSALKEALESLEQGELFQGLASDIRFLFNRRYWMKNGTVMTNPGKFNPEILCPEGDIDPEIPMLAVKSNGKIKLLITSIVNHADTVGGTGVSADWPGFYRRTIEKELGENSMVVSLTGAEGNINHFDVNSHDKQNSYGEAERIGTGYAETVLAALKSLSPVEGETMKTVFGEAVTLPREISQEEIDEAKATIAKYPDADINAGTLNSEDLAKGAPAVLKYFASALLEKAAQKEKMRLYLTGIAFGSSFILASLPSEPFTEIGLTLRKEIFGDRTCMVTALANGTGTYTNHSGYIPNAWNYGRGGYEPAPRSNPYSMKTAGIILRKWRELAKEV
ncbi:MAG: hypothetical protein IJW05_00640 [Lentisphaeria bacterium]|nr:hypothetical protein [Lentisphaeria bacterium]